MKAQILKIAGVKNEKDFYKKFPTEEAFMAKHGKALKKAQQGINFNMVDGEEQSSIYSLADKNKQLGKTVSQAMGPIGDGIEGFKALKAEKENMNQAIQMREVTGAALNAQRSDNSAQELAMAREQTYVRPEDNIITGEELFPIHGRGTNILAKKGVKMQGGGFMNFMNAGGGAATDSLMKSWTGNSGGTQIGGAVGDAVGMIPGVGPVAKQIIKPVAQAIGHLALSHGNQNRMKKAQAAAGRNTDRMMGMNMGNTVNNNFGSFMQHGGSINDDNDFIHLPKHSDPAVEESRKIAYAKSKGLDNTQLAGFESQDISDALWRKQRDAYFSDYRKNWINSDKNHPNLSQSSPEYRSMIDNMKSSWYKNNPRVINDTVMDYRNSGPAKSSPEFMNNITAFQHGGDFGGQGGTDDVRTLWGGRKELLSYNPFATGDGSTEILRGQSHSNTTDGKSGIGIAYGDNIVEAEGGEPLVEVPSEDGTTDMHVAGDLPVNNDFKKEMQAFSGIKLKGNNYKSFIKDIAKHENKQNSLIDKNIEKASELVPHNKMDKIALETLKLNIDKVYSPKLKSLQQIKEFAMDNQQAINSTAEQYNLDPTALAKGKVSKAKTSSSSVAKDGKKMSGKKEDPPTRDKEGRLVFKDEKEAIEAGFYKTTKNGKTVWESIVSPGQDPDRIKIDGKARTVKKTVPGTPPKKDPYVGPLASKESWEKFLNSPESADYRREFIDGTPDQVIEETVYDEPQYADIVGIDPIYDYATIDGPAAETSSPEKPEGSKFPWETALGYIPSLLRNSDAEAFNNRQIIPEISALANNHLQPVDAQKFQPLLDVPYDVSYQDAMNSITGSSRNAERMLAYNPGALAGLKAEEYKQISGVKGQEFRDNQAMKDRVYSGNRATLNDAQLKNLAIMDQQYVRQDQARANTRDINHAALDSITNKRSQHNLENRTLATWENMYDYRFGSNYRANYQGGPVNFENWNKGPSAQEQIREQMLRKQREAELKKAGKTPNFVWETAKNGRLIKAYKKY